MTDINISYSELLALCDHDLKNHIMSVRAKINQKKKLNEDTKKLEIYMCYAIRELESRTAFVHYKK
jgi:hypothetical protein